MGIFDCLTNLITQTYLRIKKFVALTKKPQTSEVLPVVESPTQTTQQSKDSAMDTRRLYSIDYYGDTNSLLQNSALPSRPSRHSSRNSPSSSSQRTHPTASGNPQQDFTSEDIMCEEKLKEKLREKRIDVHKGHRKSFVPRSDIKALVTVPVILKAILAGNKDVSIDQDEVQKFAKVVEKQARRVFALLAWLKKSGDIYSLCKNDIFDEQLPLMLHNANGKLSLRTKQGTLIPTCESWDADTLEEFDRFQWSVSAPVFKIQTKNSPCLEFPEETVLPFIPLSEQERKKSAAPHKREGGYSEVTAFYIHDAHHNFWEPTKSVDNRQLVAIKKLLTDDKSEFTKEKSILEILGLLNHPHLIKLLTTYRMDGHYHLVFPCASSNLRMYWEDRPFPSFDKETTLWSVKQMKGMAWALSNIHTFRVTIDLSVDGGTRVMEDGRLDVKGGEEKYGRHGDIKPENILWFKQVLGYYDDDENGVLQITDFGLGRFHGRESRSNIDHRKVHSPPTYEPPECQLERPISRSYDLWSLGCLYLEFVTWLLKGAEEIHTFADCRGKQVTSIINDDSFFTIFPNQHNGEKVAEVREDVLKWVNELHAAPKCSQAMHEILDLVMDHLLKIDAGDRISACNLCAAMNKILTKAEQDKDYLLKAVPHPSPKKSVKSKKVRISETWPQISR